MAHVYLITNKINNKQYVGVTHHDDIMMRFETHRYGRIRLSNAIRKYGAHNFLVESIKECVDIDEAYSLETYYINFYNTKYPTGYNFSDGGKGSKKGHGNSMPTSEDTKRKISESKKGQYWGANLSEEQLAIEYKKRALSRTGKTRGSYNTGQFKDKIWINKDNKVKRIDTNFLEEYENQGWIKGYITNRVYKNKR